MADFDDAQRGTASSAKLMPGGSIRQTHPLIVVAAGAVTLLCVIGIGVMTGLIPNLAAQGPTVSTSDAVTSAPSPLAAGAASAPIGNADDVALPEPARAASPATTQLPPIQNPSLGQPNSKRESAKAVVAPSASAAQTGSTRTSAPVPTYAQNKTPVYNAATSAAPLPDTTSGIAPQVAAALLVVCRQCGIVDGIFPIEKKGEGTGAGAVVGGLIGGVLGHQVGQGRGKDVATAAGAVGGALLGNEVEKDSGRTSAFNVRVRMDDNTFRTVHFESVPAVRLGDKVRFEDGRLVRR